MVILQTLKAEGWQKLSLYSAELCYVSVVIWPYLAVHLNLFVLLCFGTGLGMRCDDGPRLWASISSEKINTLKFFWYYLIKRLYTYL